MLWSCKSGTFFETRRISRNRHWLKWSHVTGNTKNCWPVHSCYICYAYWPLVNNRKTNETLSTWWLLKTCQPTANPSPAFLVVATCDRLTVVISTSHMWNLLRTEGVHLHTPALQTGTHFLLTLETIVFLFHLLSATSKPSLLFLLG